MTLQRACDLCRFYRQNVDGSSAVHRYGLSRQVKGNEMRPSGYTTYKTLRGFGGLDICDECWEKHAAPKQRPELKGKTGRKK